MNFPLGSDVSCEAVYEDSAVHITYLAGDVHEDPRSFKMLESGSGFWVGCPNGLTRTEPRLGEYKGVVSETLSRNYHYKLQREFSVFSYFLQL